MPVDDVLEYCRGILQKAHKQNHEIPLFDSMQFLDGVQVIRDVVKFWTDKQKERTPWLKGFLYRLRELEVEFEGFIKKDPMMLYKPAHAVSYAFHTSEAQIRYYRAGNRTSKSQSGYAEHYLISTGQNTFRDFLPPPTASFIIGVNFSKYAPNVFERKFITGEPGNKLSPMFPQNGKWLHKYDDRKHIIYVACKDCAEQLRPKQCKHLKSTITLYSDLEGPDVLQGGQYNLGHFDEHISEEFFTEAMERLKTVPKSGLIITGTPLLGKNSWEHKKLTSVWLRGPNENRVPGTEQPYVSLHVIDQYEAGLVPHDKIEASKLTMDPLEIESRIYGRPAPLARKSVFDRFALFDMEKEVITPVRGEVWGNWEDAQEFMEGQDGNFSIWEEPQVGAQYVVGCDVAMGVVDGDYSCASVVKVPDLQLVAQYHGHINPVGYGEKIASIGGFYNMACLVVERTGGFGVATIERLKEIGYPNVFRDVSDASSVDFNQDPVYGVDTNIKTKGHMVSCLKEVVRQRLIRIPCAATLNEMMAFGQEETPSGLSVRLRGEGGENDDRVMSLVFAVYVGTKHDIFDFTKHMKKFRDAQMRRKDPIWGEIDREIAEEKRFRINLW